MVSYILNTLLLPPAAWLLYTVWCIAVNYRIARRVGVSLVVIPISPENILWIIFGKYLLPYFELLPFGNGNFTRFCRYGWQTSDNGKAHLELGDAFITVTPGKNWLYVCNPEAVLDIFQRGSDFPRKVEIVGSKPSILTVAGKTLNLPPDMQVNPNFLATHTQPRFWGPDALQWRPSRWIFSSPRPPHLKSIEGEDLYVPPKGSFVPWAEGPRSCPGKKFAQVEHVAVMAALFRNHRVQPVLKAGESMKQACLRIMDVVDDKGMVLLLQMLNPENAIVEWKRR